MSLPTAVDLLSMDFSMDGAPFVNVSVNTEIFSESMDFCLDAKPWFGILLYIFEILHILPEDVSNLISITIDNNTTITSGFLYVTMAHSFIVIDMATKTVYDLYTYASAGRSAETLNYEPIENSSVN